MHIFTEFIIVILFSLIIVHIYSFFYIDRWSKLIKGGSICEVYEKYKYRMLYNHTRCVAGYIVDKLKTEKNGKKLSADFIKDLTHINIIGVSILCTVILLGDLVFYYKGECSTVHFMFSHEWGFRLVFKAALLSASIVLGFRIIEIVTAFYSDVKQMMRGEELSTELDSFDRIYLAIWSYVEMILAFGIINYTALMFADGNSSALTYLGNAIYYSGVTITTLGYGDILPQYMPLKLLSIVEVISGFSLIVLALAAYNSSSGSNQLKT